MIKKWCREHKIIYQDYHDKIDLESQPKYRKIYFAKIQSDISCDNLFNEN
jgi:hypothetical protein